MDGTPIMRPLLYDFPYDDKVWDIENEFMFGSDYLVAPVEDEGYTSRVVYLPEGSVWCNAWTGEEVKGGAEIVVSAPLEQIPFFVRYGASNPLK